MVVNDLPQLGGFFAGLRLRYFGSRPLIEDDSVRSGETILLNAQAGYRFNLDWALTVDVFNVIDRKDDDITYLYESQFTDRDRIRHRVRFGAVATLKNNFEFGPRRTSPEPVIGSGAYLFGGVGPFRLRCVLRNGHRQGRGPGYGAGTKIRSHVAG